MRHAVYCALALATVLVQVMFVDGLSLPGGSVPDIALVLVVALALARGPVTGMLTGFFAGLGLDLAPPGGYLIGGSALVFCVIGYGCGRFSRRADRSVPCLLAVSVIAVGAGEAALAAGGLIAGDGGITLAAVLRGLPAAVLYDVLLCAVLLSAAVVRGSRSQASQAGRLAARSAALAVLSGTGAVSGGKPLRDRHRGDAASACAATSYETRAYGGRAYLGHLDRGGLDHIRSGRGAATGVRPDGGGVRGIRFDRVRLPLARAARGEQGPAAMLAPAKRHRPANLSFLGNRPGSGPARAARRRGAGPAGLRTFPRSLFRRQPRMCRRVPRWTGGRSARHGGSSGDPGGPR